MDVNSLNFVFSLTFSIFRLLVFKNKNFNTFEKEIATAGYFVPPENYISSTIKVTKRWYFDLTLLEHLVRLDLLQKFRNVRTRELIFVLKEINKVKKTETFSTKI